MCEARIFVFSLVFVYFGCQTRPFPVNIGVGYFYFVRQLFVLKQSTPGGSYPPNPCRLSDNQEHIACFKTAMRAPNLRGGIRQLLSDSIEEWQKRVTEIEPQQQGGGGGVPDYFADLPEAPTTKPVSRPSSRAGASRGATSAAGASSNGGYAKAEEGACGTGGGYAVGDTKYVEKVSENSGRRINLLWLGRHMYMTRAKNKTSGSDLRACLGFEYRSDEVLLCSWSLRGHR